MFLIKNNNIKEIKIYPPEIIDICSIEKSKSIISPKRAVPNAVENTINAVVSALIDPINLTPYNSAHVDDPKTFAKPFDTPINPRKKNEEIGDLK